MRAKGVCVCFFALALLGCSFKEKPAGGALPPPVVVGFEVVPKTIPAVFEFVGVAKSSHSVEIRARVEGYLWSIDYEEGSPVKKGDLLFQIDPRPFEASLSEAKGGLAREEAMLWRAKRSLERMTSLFSKNAVSQRDLDNATASVLMGEANVAAAKANLTQAELNLSYTRVISPIDGLSSRALYREGTLITPNVNGLLAIVSVVDPLWVVFSVSDNELLQGRGESANHTLILPEQQEYTVELEFADGTMFPHKGKVNFTSPTLNPDTGSVTVRAAFSNPEKAVLPGQFVRAYVSGASRPNAIIVPQEAVCQGEDGPYVFVIGKGGKISMREVKLGPWYKEYWIIQKGLTSGEKIVAEGTNKVVEGMVVSIESMKTPLPKEGS